jgi:hypothetical protein
MKKLPVAGPTYDYKLENIRNDIIEQELALCLKRQEDLAQNATIVDGDGNTTTLRANLDTEFYTRTEADSAIASATTSLVSETALNTALSDYTTTASLEANYYTETEADSAIASATTNLVSTTDLTTALGDYTTTSSLETNYYTKTSTDSAISSATTNLVSTAGLTAALNDYTTTASLQANYYTETEADNAISSAITTNNVTIGNTYATISTVSSVSGDVDAIEGKYAVKVNTNGHVSGFGLISTANNATPTSTFTVTADAFKIVDTSGAATPAAPFSVYTSSRTVDGVTVPAGVYMENANITSAQIKTLDADVITAGTVSADRLSVDGVTIDTSGGNLIVKNGGVNTTQIATDAISSSSKAFVGSFSITSRPTFGQTVASINVSGVYGDKFLCIATANYFSLPVADDGDFFAGYIFLNNSSTVYLDRHGYGYDYTQKGGFTLAGVNTLNTTGSSIPLDFRILQNGSGNSSATVYNIHLQAIKLER